ncbi:MAG TPA: hypothetical protein VK601_24385, partial [Kofleriaceae bacterium]|nr:hypothetical protein [Kofleriaceae bacterium]
MRCVAGVGLVLLVGCNQIFGIAATQPWDAPPDVVPDLPHVVLTWQLATTAPSGAPSPALEYPPFAAGAAPQIRIATLDGPWAPAAYSSSPGKEGWIEIPRSYFDSDGAGTHPTWRLEYTLVGGAPHEVQWAPDDKIAHLVVPMVGRLDRQSAPLGGGYRVTPSGYAGPYTFPQLFTTGLWTAGIVNPPSSGVTVDYDYSSASSLNGAQGRPDATRGDRGFLVDFIFDPTTMSNTTLVECRVAAGSAALTDVALEASAHTAQTPTWDSARLPVMADAANLAALDQLTTGLGKLHGTFQGKLSWLLFGSVPSTDFPGLTGVSSQQTIPLPIPVMQVLFQCPYDATPRPATAQPLLLRDFPSVLHAQLVDSRKV